MPAHQRPCHCRYEECLDQAIQAHKLHEDFNLLHSALIRLGFLRSSSVFGNCLLWSQQLSISFFGSTVVKSGTKVKSTRYEFTGTSSSVAFLAGTSITHARFYPNQSQTNPNQLASAKTGFGVEGLISQILGQWGDLGDVYLAGCANTGKSTLFNKLMQSDLCKVGLCLGIRDGDK